MLIQTDLHQLRITADFLLLLYTCKLSPKTYRYIHSHLLSDSGTWQVLQVMHPSPVPWDSWCCLWALHSSSLLQSFKHESKGNCSKGEGDSLKIGGARGKNMRRKNMYLATSFSNTEETIRARMYRITM